VKLKNSLAKMSDILKFHNVEGEENLIVYGNFNMFALA